MRGNLRVKLNKLGQHQSQNQEADSLSLPYAYRREDELVFQPQRIESNPHVYNRNRGDAAGLIRREFPAMESIPEAELLPDLLRDRMKSKHDEAVEEEDAESHCEYCAERTQTRPQQAFPGVLFMHQPGSQENT